MRQDSAWLIYESADFRRRLRYLLKEISEALKLSDHTVDTYLRRIYEKLHVHSRAQAAARYAELKPQSAAMRRGD